MAGEIEVDFARGRRTAMQNERLRLWVGRRRRDRRGVGTHGSLHAVTEISGGMSGSEMQVMVMIAGLKEVGPRNAGEVS